MPYFGLSDDELASVGRIVIAAGRLEDVAYSLLTELTGLAPSGFHFRACLNYVGDASRDGMPAWSRVTRKEIDAWRQSALGRWTSETSASI